MIIVIGGKRMKNNEFDIQRKEGTFYTTLSFFIPDEIFTKCVSSVLEDVIKKYSLPEENIVDVQFSKTVQKEQKLISVVIKYCNFNLYELENLDNEEQIRFVLKFMGYADKDIKSISYRKYWSNSNELVWVATVSDSNHNFDLDESFCQRDYEVSIRSAIESVLNFRVIIDFF